jgi:hypothetical protein
MRDGLHPPAVHDTTRPDALKVTWATAAKNFKYGVIHQLTAWNLWQR